VGDSARYRRPGRLSSDFGEIASVETSRTNRETPFGIYVHVPFCARRCGYCDFNTYTARELGGGASQARYAELAKAEIDLMRTLRPSRAEVGRGVVSTGSTTALRLSLSPHRPVTTVFFGGGTPTILPAADLVSIRQKIEAIWGLAPEAEVTTEANPDSVSRESLDELAAGGFTRVSFGMQSAVPHVLRTLDRTHDADRVPLVVQWAKSAGLRVSLDLIYGTPGESLADWRASVLAALATGVDHISAYALSIHPGTAMYARVQRGELPAPDDDDEADKYELADELLSAAGLEWYEISNWARGGISGDNVCQHNLGYWRGSNWFGIGPGAHSHFEGTRWWNVKHPRRWAEMIEAGELPIEDSETLSAEQVQLENVLLASRLADGLPIADLERPRQNVVADLIAQGLVESDPVTSDGRIVLTRNGRLLADTVVQRLTD